MKNRTPTPRDQRAPLPDFAPVPRHTPRHDGWTPERQRAFIEALADTGSITTAAAMVNMTPESAYMLRRHPEAGGFRAAWTAALDMGVLRIKDEAFERALKGELVPVFAGGRLLGYRRKKNDRLLMFILRHYGEDAAGRRTTLNLFQTRVDVTAAAEAGAAPPHEATALAPPTHAAPALPAPAPKPARRTRRARGTPPAPRSETAAATLAGFAPALLDAAEQAQVLAILEAAAARQRAAAPATDPAESYVPGDLVPLDHPDAIGGGMTFEDRGPPRDGDEAWYTLDQPDQRAAIAEAVAAIKAAKARGEF